MKVLVTGIAGFIGSHIADGLIKKGYEVFGIDNLRCGEINNIPKEVLDNGKFTIGDLTVTEAVKEYMEKVKPDIIYHLACYPYESLSQFCPVEVANNTYIASLNVFRGAVNNDVRRVVYFSSSARYGRGELPSKEGQPRIPVDIYGASKVAAEIALEALSEACGLEYVILVPHNVSGARMKLDDPYRGVLAVWINNILQDRPFYIYGDGEQKRAYSHIDDIVEPCIKAGFEKEAKNQIINIGSAKIHTLNEIANILKSKNGAKFEYIPERSCAVQNAYCTIEKSKELLGFEDRKTIYDILQDIINYAKEVGTKEFKYRELEIVKGMPEIWTGKN